MNCDFPFLFLKESHAAQVLPNAFFNRILVPPENIRKLSRTEWENKEVILDEWMRKFQSENRIIFQIPEGAFCREALPGAMTLGSEILRHEETLNISFDTIYIDSGSGLTAAVLFHFFEAAGINKQIRIYLAAGKEADFEQAITITADWLQAGFGSYSQGSVSRDFIGASEPKFRGKLSGEKKEFIQTFARKHGILLDPFYNSGLFSLALKEIQSSNEKGNSLIIHSGGVAALLGYPEFDS